MFPLPEGVHDCGTGLPGTENSPVGRAGRCLVVGGLENPGLLCLRVWVSRAEVRVSAVGLPVEALPEGLGIRGRWLGGGVSSTAWEKGL